MCSGECLVRSCPVCHGYSDNIFASDGKVDLSNFYCACPTCHWPRITLIGCTRIAIEIAGENIIAAIQLLQCQKCETRYFSAVRCLIKCTKCGFEFDAYIKRHNVKCQQGFNHKLPNGLFLFPRSRKDSQEKISNTFVIQHA